MRILTHTVPKMKMAQQSRRQDRGQTYQGMGRLVWMRYCLENNIVDTPFERAPVDVKRGILEACEALANMVLNPDLHDTAILCVADAICRSTNPDRTISEVS